MVRNRKFQAFVYFVTIVFLLSGPVQAYSASRIVPSGQIEVYKNGQLVQVLQEEGPLPVGSVLKAKGQCGIRMDNLFLVAEDGAAFSIEESAGAVHIAIEKGLIYYGINSQTGRLAFTTPAGVIETRQMVIDASAGQGMIKGYIDVTDGVRMGVLEGGSMVVATPVGERTIGSGNQITIAQGGADKGAPAGSGGQSGGGQGAAQGSAGQKADPYRIPTGYYVAGAAILGVGALAVVGLNGFGGDGDDDPAPASPASP